MKDLIIEGHRGLNALYPENTMLSYRSAFAAGVDAIEIDVWLTSDKVPVLMHDGNALRTCGVNRNLRDMTYSEVKQLNACYTDKFGDKFAGLGEDTGVPSLEQLLAYAKENCPQMIMGVEIKDYADETVDRSVALLKQYGFFDGCYFCDFSSHVIKYVKSKYGAFTRGYLDYRMIDFDSDTYSYYDAIGVPMMHIKSEIFPVYVKKNLPLHMYCADTEDDVRLCLDRGASLISVNDPTALFNVLHGSN